MFFQWMVFQDSSSAAFGGGQTNQSPASVGRWLALATEKVILELFQLGKPPQKPMYPGVF